MSLLTKSCVLLTKSFVRPLYTGITRDQWPRKDQELRPNKSDTFHYREHPCIVSGVLSQQTKHLYNIYTMLEHRLRRWTNIDKCYTNVLCLLLGIPLRDTVPSKHKTFVQHLYNVGPTSSTLDQQCIKVIQFFCVFAGNCPHVWSAYTLRSRKAVCASFTSEQILAFGLARQEYNLTHFLSVILIFHHHVCSVLM